MTDLPDTFEGVSPELIPHERDRRLFDVYLDLM